MRVCVCVCLGVREKENEREVNFLFILKTKVDLSTKDVRGRLSLFRYRQMVPSLAIRNVECEIRSLNF